MSGPMPQGVQWDQAEILWSGEVRTAGSEWRYVVMPHRLGFGGRELWEYRLESSDLWHGFDCPPSPEFAYRYPNLWAGHDPQRRRDFIRAVEEWNAEGIEG